MEVWGEARGAEGGTGPGNFFNEAIVFQGASGETFCCVKSNPHSQKKTTKHFDGFLVRDVNLNVAQ